MTQPQVWTTKEVASALRSAWWRNLMNRQFHGLETDLYGDRTCDGQMVVNNANGIKLVRLTASRHRVTKNDSTGPESTSPWKIVAPFQGEVWVEQHDRVAHAKPGEWIIYDTGTAYSVANPDAVDHLVVMIPRDFLADIGANVHDLLARPLGARGLGQVLLHTMRITFAELGAMAPALRSAAGEAVAQYVRLSLLEEASQHCPRSHRAAMRERIQAYVQRHLNDPDLSIDAIASALRCSKRLLHAAFQGSGHTLNSYIQLQRLEACARDLPNPELRHWPIIQIAASRGFTNASHFSRSFREHKNMSPREWRKNSLQKAKIETP